MQFILQLTVGFNEAMKVNGEQILGKGELEV